MFLIVLFYFIILSALVNIYVGIGGFILFCLLWKRVIRKYLLTTKGIIILLVVNFMLFSVKNIYLAAIISVFLLISLLIHRNTLKKDNIQEEFERKIKNKEIIYYKLGVKCEDILCNCKVTKEFILDKEKLKDLKEVISKCMKKYSGKNLIYYIKTSSIFYKKKYRFYFDKIEDNLLELNDNLNIILNMPDSYELMNLKELEIALYLFHNYEAGKVKEIGKNKVMMIFDEEHKHLYGIHQLEKDFKEYSEIRLDDLKKLSDNYNNYIDFFGTEIRFY